MNGAARLNDSWASAMSAKVPPSPRLSARVRISTYFSVTTTISDQKISDRTPSTAARLTPGPSAAASIASRKA